MYWTKSPGTGGSIRSEEDFIVEEVPLKKFFIKFTRSKSGVIPVTGPYHLYLLKKKGLTTRDAIKRIEQKLGIAPGYAGLKDKFAVTSQYITLKKKVPNYEDDKLSLAYVAPCLYSMAIGELEGNNFTIKLRGCKAVKNAKKIIGELESRGVPNYFGVQRFSENNDKIGLLILKRKFPEALTLINKSYHKKFSSLKAVDKKILKFLIHAYQSRLFNRMLDKYVERGKAFSGVLPIIGFNTKPTVELKNIMEKDSISPEDFRISELGMTVTGSERRAFVKTKISYEISRSTLVLKFFLPKGSYATEVVRQIAK